MFCLFLSPLRENLSMADLKIKRPLNFIGNFEYSVSDGAIAKSFVGILSQEKF